ncbi:ATP-binding protein [Flavobacterium agricola]|uniref:ATP-binding protein n=1 Tax=Flavobacterium agricola TaxID=2870839 RepID=UPI0022226DC7|nr:ATP-binding protein [Flavobacterium agricola]
MLLTKLQNHIQENFSEIGTAKLLLAVSGGVDSMVMLHTLNKLNYNVTVAHCNFRLRGSESDEETEFLKKYILLIKT